TPPSAPALALGLFGRCLGQSSVLLVGSGLRFGSFRLGLRRRNLVQIRFLAAPPPPAPSPPPPGRFADFGGLLFLGGFFFLDRSLGFDGVLGEGLGFGFLLLVRRHRRRLRGNGLCGFEAV